MFPDKRHAAVYARLVELGPVVLTSDDLLDPRAFKHRSHPLSAHAEVLVEVLGLGGEVWDLRDAVWWDLVATELVPALDVHVELASGSYNAAYARFVDGLTDNEEALDEAQVSVPADAVAQRFLAAVTGSLVPVDLMMSPRPSVLEAGLPSLVGRRVEVSFLGPVEGLVGTLVSHTGDALVLDNCGESLAVVPLSAVAYVSTYQRTLAED